MFTINVVFYVLMSATLFGSNVIWYQSYLAREEQKRFKHKYLWYSIFLFVTLALLAWCIYGLAFEPEFVAPTRADTVVGLLLVSLVVFFQVGSFGLYRRASKRLKETRAATVDPKPL